MTSLVRPPRGFVYVQTSAPGGFTHSKPDLTHLPLEKMEITGVGGSKSRQFVSQQYRARLKGKKRGLAPHKGLRFVNIVGQRHWPDQRGVWEKTLMHERTIELTVLLPIEKWEELEREIHKRSGLDAYVYDSDGMSITNFKKWANRLCPVIKATNKGLAFICAVANQNLANEAIQRKGPVIGECDAGLLKVAVPIFVGDEFVGVAGGCGHILDHSEVESFLVHKILGIEEEKIARLSGEIPRVNKDEVERLMEYIQDQVDRIVSDFEKQGK